MKNFKKLYVWTKSMELTACIYKATSSFPMEEHFGITSQIKRSAVSIPSNISEGCGRRTTADHTRFFDIALGSSFELETQIILAKDLGFLKNEDADKILNKITFVQVALSNYLATLRNKNKGIQMAGVIAALALICWKLW